VGTPSEVVDLWHNEFPDDVVGCLEPACGVKEGGVRRLVCFGQPRNRRYAALFEEFQRNPLLKLDPASVFSTAQHKLQLKIIKAANTQMSRDLIEMMHLPWTPHMIGLAVKFFGRLELSPLNKGHHFERPKSSTFHPIKLFRRCFTTQVKFLVHCQTKKGDKISDVIIFSCC
jgi:hypothetical protein